MCVMLPFSINAFLNFHTRFQEYKNSLYVSYAFKCNMSLCSCLFLPEADLTLRVWLCTELYASYLQQ